MQPLPPQQTDTAAPAANAPGSAQPDASFAATQPPTTTESAQEARKRRMCQSKRRYPDKRAAQTVLNHAAKTPGREIKEKGLHIYPCEYCQGWHMAKGGKGRQSVRRTAQKKNRRLREGNSRPKDQGRRERFDWREEV